MKPGDAVQLGDIIRFLGQPHRITRIEPYDHPALGGAGARIAYADDGWAITLTPEVEVEVL